MTVYQTLLSGLLGEAFDLADIGARATARMSLPALIVASHLEAAGAGEADIREVTAHIDAANDIVATANEMLAKFQVVKAEVDAGTCHCTALGAA